MSTQLIMDDIVFTPMDDDDFEFINLEDVANRANEIEQLSHDITQIHEIFKEFDNLVQDQQIYVDLIADNINFVKNHVEEGEKELIKAEEHQIAYNNKFTKFISLPIVACVVVIAAIKLSKS